MSLVHFSHHGSLTEAMVGFSELCRESGLAVGLSHTQEAIQASSLGFIHDEASFRYGLRSLFCTCGEEHQIFDKCFDVFWLKRKHTYAHKTSTGSTNITKKSKSSLVMAGFKPKGAEEPKEMEEASNVTGASKIESLKYTDFSKVAEMDSDFLDELTNKLLQQLNHRLKRKLQQSKRGPIDIRQSIRKNLSNGAELIDLAKQRKKKEKHRLVILLDVSGSMDKYSFYLLRFVWSLKSHLKNIEAFVFSTHLVRITEFLQQEQLTNTLLEMSHHARSWSGGTKIGECLADFNEQYAKRVLNGRSITIILSDGLDDGAPETMSEEIQKIKLRTSKLVWLNPLKGMEGYAPLARGMAAALPLVDNFQSAHNLQSLMELENILSDV
ncbi:MAG: VWA domain-containing protein [Bacteroidota bacterium]